MTVGFVVGKFYPPHRGHKHLIEVARRQVDELVVLIAHHPSQKIPGEVRAAWLREIHPDCDVRLVPDELANDHQAWAKFTLEFLGRKPDVVFSSEDYGPLFAGAMGSKHVMVDRDRLQFPISGTAVRESPPDHLDFLEPCVRAWFIRRVVILGAESTGKTTLARRLAQHFHTEWVAEYGREHWEKKVAVWKETDPAPQWTPDEFLHIATEQQRRENLAARTANRILFCDTNAFATGTWHERYRQSRDPRVDAVGAGDKVDAYLLTACDVPFVQDGFRDGEKIRDWMHGRFAEQLRAQSAPVYEITGSYDERFRQAVVAAELTLRRPYLL